MADAHRTLKRLASLSDDESPRNRTAIRAALAPIVEDLRHDLDLVSLALTGPDPEFALYEFVEVLGELPATVRKLSAEVRS